MKTDQEILLDLLASAGVTGDILPGASVTKPGAAVVVVVDNFGDRGGHLMFHSHWHFDAAGKLLGVAHWE